MIIHKDTKSVETLSNEPNSNFGNYQNVFVVDDNSELGNKILQHQPYFDFSLNENGELIDIIPTERPIEPEPEPTDLEILGQSISEREIQEIVQGQQISDLEIRLLVGGL